jgi:hypothetical protein
MTETDFLRDFQRNGYYLFRGFFSADEVTGISKVIHPRACALARIESGTCRCQQQLPDFE